jgi:hypothetical protein
MGKKNLDWLDYTEQFSGGYESSRLRSKCCHYANIMSYNEVSKLLQDETGVSLLSDQRIHAIIHDEAVKVSECNSKEAKAVLASGKALPAINKEVGIYDSSVNEVLLFNDGIQVKKQKENREKRSEPPCNKAADSSQSNADKRESRIQTDVIMLEKADGNYIHLMEGIEKKSDAGASLEELLTSTIITEYGSKKDGLNLVAITDGAGSIRLYFERVFGFAIMLILDWYHLKKKIWNLMSMISWNKSDKEIHCDILLKQLWTGQVDDALTYLKSVTPKNQKKYDELITYLTKHKTEIINYKARKDAGKTIGSGRMEKGVDIVIGRRQKDNGMSWSEAGSKALGILKVNELNNRIKLPDSDSLLAA